MPKTYYLGRTNSGAIVCRASTRPGYTHAAVWPHHKAGEILDAGIANFSSSPQGAINARGKFLVERDGVEVVTLEIVDGKAYRAATGKG